MITALMIAVIGIVARRVISGEAKHPVMQHGWVVAVVAVIIVAAIGGGLAIDFDLGV